MVVRATQVGINIVESAKVQPVRVSNVAINLIYNPPQPVRTTQVAVLTVFPLDPIKPKSLVPVWPIVETWQWKTAITKSLSGKEQRMSLRAEPFVSFSYDLPTLSDEDRQTFLYTLHRYGGKVMPYPAWQYQTPVTGSRSAGATTIDFDATSTNMRVGEKIAVFNSDLSSYAVLTISSLASGSCNVSDPYGLPFAIDSTFTVAPAPDCRFGDGQTFNVTRYFGNASLKLNIEPGRALLRPSQSTGLISTFDSMPILPDGYLVGNGVAEQLTYNMKEFDTGLNQPNIQRNWHNPQFTFSREYKLDYADLDKWREFGDTIKGARIPFLAPSFRSDVRLNAVPSLGSEYLTTNDTFVADYMKDFGSRYLQIETANGVIQRRVLEVWLEQDSTVTLRLATALGGAAGDNVISKVSIMNKVRLAGDEMRFIHYKNHIEASFSIATIGD